MGGSCSSLKTIDLNQHGMEELIDACVIRVLSEVLLIIKPENDEETTGKS